MIPFLIPLNTNNLKRMEYFLKLAVYANLYAKCVRGLLGIKAVLVDAIIFSPILGGER